MSAEAAIIESIERLAEESRRARPYLVAGLLAIFIGFALLIFYIDGERRSAEQRARKWEATAKNLDLTLKKAMQSRNQEETSALLSSAESQTRQLAAVAAEEAAGAEPAAAEPPSGPVLIYIRVSEEEQQVAALALESRLEAADLGARPILVPRMAIAATTGQSSLRCYRPADCGYADDLLRVVQQQMPAPPVRVRDLSGQFHKVPPGTFELWLAPGPIELK
jgi:hypothetical protein